MSIMKPIINLNGSDAQSMINARLEAREQCLELIKALGEIRPHARDYPGCPDVYKEDLEIFQKRMQKLDELYNVLMDEALKIQEGFEAEPLSPSP